MLSGGLNLVNNLTGGNLAASPKGTGEAIRAPARDYASSVFENMWTITQEEAPNQFGLILGIIYSCGHNSRTVRLNEKGPHREPV